MIFDFIGGLVFGILFYVEIYLHVPLVFALVSRLSNSVARQMAHVYLINKFFVAIVSSLFSGAAYKFLVRISPPTQEEELAKLHYIHEHALSDPDLALDMIEKEQSRLLSRFPDYLHAARAEDSPPGTADYRMLSKAFGSISTELTAFLSDLMKNPEMDSTTSNRLLNLLDRNNLIVSVERNLFQFVETARKAGNLESLEMMMYNFIEGMDSLQRAAVEAMQTGNNADIDLLLTITFDRGGLMEQMRKDSFSEGMTLGNQDRANLFYLISLFERGVWLLNKLGKSLKEGHPESLVAQAEWAGEGSPEPALTEASGLN
jgi:phosphate:Na+ symporter